MASRFDEGAYLAVRRGQRNPGRAGGRGIAVSEALAAELQLKCPDAPWHGHRDRLAALMAALSIYTASLGKMALDIALLMQFEVGEAAEAGRGWKGRVVHHAAQTQSDGVACWRLRRRSGRRGCWRIS